ncbi:mitochondrial fission ELM1 family protein [Roseococcus sp. DSY-14]|uniref:mitochondrial fission ELM1 family protein n=1 Tax=Roseococcus sp. DSY-14 TaxID=3369650 RepID=UPI00387AD921
MLEDPRAGTANQALGIAERLGVPFRRVKLRFGALAGVPWPWPTLAGLADHSAFAPPWPRLVVSAGRRAAPVARWLGRRGARLVHCMRPGWGAGEFDLLVLGSHDGAAPGANMLEILGSTHRVTPAALAAAPLLHPAPEIALLLGGPVRGVGMDVTLAVKIAQQTAELGRFLWVTTSRRTGEAATEAVAAALAATPHRLHRFGGDGPNPYLSLLAQAKRIVVTGDSVSMLSEALMSPAPLLVAEPPWLGRRHRALLEALVSRGLAAPLGSAPPPPRAPLDETGRVAQLIRQRGWI